MDLERIKNFLQNYLNSVVEPKVNSKRNELGIEPIRFIVYDILKGSYQPPIIHVFLDTEPTIKKTATLKPHAVMMLNEVEKDITSFFKIFSINFKMKVHWNKRPIFKNDTLYSED